MIKLPAWLEEFIALEKCPHCSKNMSTSGVFGIGVREEKIEGNRELSFCFEYYCRNCKKKTLFSGFPTNAEQFTEDVAYVFKDGWEVVNKNKKNKSSISDKDVKNFIKNLDKIKKYEDFLKKLGIQSNENDKRDKDK
jgi:hypothetical protein